MKTKYILAILDHIDTVGLVGWWKLKDSAHDYSGSGNNGTESNTVLMYPGMQFNDTNAKVEIADNAALTFALSPFSISAWVKMTDATDFPILYKWQNSNQEWSFGTHEATAVSDKLIIQLYDQTASKYIRTVSDSAITAYEGIWTHLVGTYDGSANASGLNLYINKTLTASTDATDGAFVSSRDGTAVVNIGAHTQFSKYAYGIISNVLLYSKELSLTQIENIYDAQRGLYGV